jgi:glycosyltransferase involved in cell wall biosynthesis
VGARPARIDLVIPSIVERDAVSHHTLEAQAVLHSLGYESEIYALSIGPGLRERVRQLSELDLDEVASSWLCYQASIGSPAADVVARHRGVTIVNYHNITPAPFVERWMPHLGDEVRLGRQQLEALASTVDVGIAVSPFNARELDAWGYRRTTVATLMMDRLNFEIPADAHCAQRLRTARAGGGADWLFVGQMLPHKAHHDVVTAFAAYRAAYDPQARLRLVGRDSCQAYALGIELLVDELGLSDCVEIAGSVSPGELAAYYEASDCYVSCSDHEGFGAPLLEAMQRGLPVVAFGAAAVPETVAGAGIVLQSKEPAVVAAAVHEVLTDAALRERLRRAGRERAASFSVDRGRSEFAGAIETAVSELCGEAPGPARQRRGQRPVRRPVRIDQVAPSIVDRDAVSFHTLEAQRVLRSLGFVSEVYAVTMGPEMAGRVHPLAELPRESGDRQWLCYQASIGSPAAEVVAGHPATRLVNYHNITPAALVEGWMPGLAEEVRIGREQVAALASGTLLGMGDSAYNTAELDEWGYPWAVVSMLMVDRTNFDAVPDAGARARLVEARRSGGSDWLFVGQMLPHKAQHDVILAFAAYLRAYDPEAHLHLVGRDSSPAYTSGLRELVGDLGIADSVDFVGLVRPGELAALYQSCDVYVCCSDHEGFCAPLLEAMHHGLPIVAYRAAAVPETIADAGVLLDSKAPAEVAAAAHRVVTDDELRARLIALGRERAASFAPERARAEFARVVEAAVAVWAERG